MRKSRAVASLAVVSALIVACGSAVDPSLYGEGATVGKDGTGNGGNGGLFGAGGGGGGAGADFAACASDVADGELRPVHMVLSLDISGSMCEINDDPNNRNCAAANSKWGQTKAALQAFFTSPESSRMFVSFIPWSGNSCNGFDNPVARDVPLPDGTGTLVNAVNAQSPNGGTPTHGAIQGAQRFGTALQSSLTDKGKVIIALTTDGQPTGCSDLGQSQAAAAASAAAGFPVYVIGVGNAATNLRSIAQSGGTRDQFNVSSASATSDFVKALQTIRGNALACNLALPSPPAGQQLDFRKINVVLDTGASNTVPYSQDCADPKGWRYTPSASAPTGIELCGGGCDIVKATPAAKLKVVLGCATRDSNTK